MKLAALIVLLVSFYMLTAVPAVQAMPPHPDLTARLQANEIPTPYYLAHEAELRAQGVENPGRVRTIDELRRRSLDENINILAILVDFSDQISQVPPVFFDSLLYGTAIGTLRDYYDEVTYGNLTLVSVNLPTALGWQRAPQTYDYYVNGQNGFGGYPQNAQGLTEDVVNLVDPQVDFSQYDIDGDGYVDGLFIIHSGPGAEFTGSGDDIWSHAWGTPWPITVDGVNVQPYSMEPEYWQSPGDMTCGVYAHEMGHAVFGLPDLYDYDYDSQGLGDWTLMAGGSWGGSWGDTPSHPDAWSRVAAGFVTDSVITTNLTAVSIPAVETSPTIYRLWTAGEPSSEYFLVENRRRTGYDVSIPASGLLIYHVDETRDGNDNQWYPGHTGSGHYLVALEQADGDWALEQNINSGDNGDPYPGSTNSHTFAVSTTPASRSYADEFTYVAVRNISAAGDTMTADFAVRPGVGNSVLIELPDTLASAGSELALPLWADTLTGQQIDSLSFTVTWDPGVLSAATPCFDRVGALVPEAWTVNETQTAGSLTITASGATALSGSGTLLRLRLVIQEDAAEGAISPVQFSTFTFNAGQPEVDLVDGSVTVGAAMLVLQPANVAFGSVPVNTSATRSVIFRNNGTSVLQIDSLTVPAGFSTNLTVPLQLSSMRWQPVRVTFTPDTQRPYNDTLIIHCNSSGGPGLLVLTGTGVNPTATDPEASSLPTRFALASSYPNPFNASTILAYDVPRRAAVTLTVYDITGRIVDTPVSGMLAPGRYRLNWSCPECASGLYLFTLSAEGQRFVQKAMLLK